MYLITGANGQLGTELCYLMDDMELKYEATTLDNLDITDQQQVFETLRRVQPSHIIHCAAYTAVDKAEDEGRDLNYKVNVDGTRYLATAAKELGIPLVYISTDYVFDGNLADGEYLVDSPTNPMNEYGKAKLQGEEVVRDLLSDYYIIRTSWVFGKYGHNFVYTMRRLAKERPQLTIVNDQYGRPTWTRTLAEFVVFLLQNQSPYGIYHLSNDDACTWYEFAREILKDTDVEVLPVTSAEFPQKAYRPKHSVMSLQKAKRLGFTIPTWRDALQQFLSSLND
ncbi:MULTISPECIES: dTDP-4-dehydrorhamnose reductase [Abiotrophia]|uniref:dTDP-4-dehydrorhamnose reductase n=1 Tax=Abiotrophia TaxID=46123 RepID=UPI001CB1CFF8|nr:dTDP-4-dehydrorhamnose reductase [Abiotrophia sp.]MBF0941993.1 dTDP-4-dehydrorhamnose reductase [Abiotrophia sp.]